MSTAAVVEWQRYVPAHTILLRLDFALVFILVFYAKWIMTTHTHITDFQLILFYCTYIDVPSWRRQRGRRRRQSTIIWQRCCQEQEGEFFSHKALFLVHATSYLSLILTCCVFAVGVLLTCTEFGEISYYYLSYIPTQVLSYLIIKLSYHFVYLYLLGSLRTHSLLERSC